MNTVRRGLQICRIDAVQQMVYGIAATEQEATDGMVVTMGALQEAWPAYMEWANVREMHQEIAAGVVREYRFTDDQRLEIGVKVSDASTWQKVTDGVLKGFSICANIIEQIGNIVNKLELIEISLVDRPADPGALVTLFRAAGARDENNTRGKAPEGGKMPDPTVPRGGKIKRDDGGSITDQIASQEGSPLDTQLDVIGLLMQKFQEFEDILGQLENGGDAVHPDVLANCYRAHQAMGRAIKSHIDNVTSNGKGGDDGSAGAGDDGAAGGEGGKPTDDGATKRAAQALQQGAVRRAASAQDPRVDGILKAIEGLTASVETVVKRAATPQAQYQPAVVQRSADAGKVGDQLDATADEFGPLEGTPEFDKLTGAQKFDVVVARSAKKRKEAAFTIPQDKE